MALENITVYLGRFKNLTPPEAAIKNAIQKSVADTFGVIVPLECITVAGRTVRLSVSPVVRTELFIRKERFSALLCERLGQKTLTIS